MDIELKVNCTCGATGVADDEKVYLSEAYELRKPGSWSDWNPRGAGHGKIRLGGGEVRYGSNLTVTFTATDPPKKRYRLEVTMTADDSHPEPAATKHCFGGSGSGEKVVGTWIAEGGG